MSRGQFSLIASADESKNRRGPLRCRADNPQSVARWNQSADDKCGDSVSPIQISYSNHQKSLAAAWEWQQDRPADQR